MDFLICLATASLLWIGPLLDAWLHPESPLWFPYATTPDFSVYMAMFRHAGWEGMTGDPFLWEHRVDPGAVLSVYHDWPALLGILIRWGGDAMIPVLGWLFSATWFWGLFRLGRAMGQPPRWAFFTAGLACFFSVNVAYNLNGYKFHFGAWNLALTEHLRPYPSASSMAVYAAAAAAFYAALARPGWKRTLVAGLLIGGVVIGRPFDWMVLETAVILLIVILGWQGDKERLAAGLKALGISLLMAGPVLWKLTAYQAAHGAAYDDQMWRGVFQAKSLLHYAKYTAALAVITAFTLAIFRWALGTGRMRSWPLHVVFLSALVIASLLPHYRTLFSGITITGFSYFFVFSLATWGTMAVLHALWVRRARAEGGWTPSLIWPLALLGMILAQQLALGLGQRERQSAHLIPPELRRLYGDITASTPPDTVILGFRSGVELAGETGRWIFSPSPTVAVLLTSASTRELLERALWSEFLMTGSLDALAPLFDPEGIPDFNAWREAQPLPVQKAVGRLEKRIGFNSFIFHPQLNRYDLAARHLVLPPGLSSGHDFAAYFPPDLRKVYEKTRVAMNAEAPLRRLPFKLDAVLTTPDFILQGGKSPAWLGMICSMKIGDYEMWRMPNSKFLHDRKRD